MSIHFHPLIVKEVRKETSDCVSIAFELGEQQKETFSFKQGQYLTVRAVINGGEVRRSYSICSSPVDDELRIAIKKVEGGLFSMFAIEQLKKGDVIEAMPPAGKFYTELNAANKKSYVAFAAGSGITPVFSIIKTTLYTEPCSDFTLFYGNRNRHSIIFKEQLEGLKNKFMNRFRIFHILSREEMDVPLNSGRINNEKCEELFAAILDASSVNEFFLCGPYEMISTVRRYLIGKGVSETKIHFELFTTPEIKKQISPARNPNSVKNVTSKITIKVDGSTFTVDATYDGDSILDVALKKGADLPFACKGGVCTTCRAKLLSGEVEMDANYSLDPEELEAGYILTCQSHPRTEKVFVDFDTK